MSVEENISEAVKNEIVRRNQALEDSRIDVGFKDPDAIFEGLTSKKEKLTYKIGIPENRRLSGNLVIPVNVYAGRNFIEQVNVNCSIKIFKKILVSSAKINKGAILTGKEMSLIEKDISVLPSTVIFEQDSILGKEAMTFIPKGTVLLDWMFKEVPVVRKGDIVELYKAVSGVNVSVKAVVLEDSYLGKNVRVRNLSSQKTVEGIVRSSKEVEAL
ncbi:MAG: flagellar basal body P-ring formation chaperone FlgA [Candidatus Saganbacteria bacterium]|nr:flagellar basal body P-ring formation chaperone FlgA [Candidatus Saganbacteria bacterium]